MELEVGMYVRTQKGNICKLLGYNEKEKVWIYMIEKEWFILYETFVKKTSHNIIDLIEVGDYVNGYPVYEIIEYEDNTRAIVIGDDNESIIWEESSQYIKTIVTKEAFESMSYKVGE